jgi:hypothetical protein
MISSFSIKEKLISIKDVFKGDLIRYKYTVYSLNSF